MPRALSLTLTLALLALLGLASAASAATLTEVGETPERNRPSCPENPCLAFTRATGYQAKIGNRRAPMRIRRDGRVVAVTFDVGRVGPSQVEFFNSRYGSPAQVQLTILRAGDRLFSRVIGVGPVVNLTRYFGRRVTLALPRSIVVRRNEVLGITSRTWAPMLATNLGPATSWRASRRRGRCSNAAEPQRQNALGLNALFQFRCLYKARLTYTATVVPRP